VEACAQLQHFGLSGSADSTVQHRSHPGHHLVRVEGFGDVIAGTQFQANDFVSVLDAGGEHDDRRVGQGGVGGHDAG